MPWDLNSDRSIFIQIIEKLQTDIIAGRYQPGSKLPSVRELAMEAAVNPNTMQKALSELERTGLVHSQRTSGRFITEDRTMIEQTKSEIARQIAAQFLENMQKIGFQKEEAVSFIAEILKGEPNATVRM